MKQDRIVVVGGYGHVGQKICLQLARLFPGNVYAAGRSKKKAEKFCSSTNGQIKPLQVDVLKTVEKSFFQNVKLVIVCIDQVNTDFVRTCLSNGIDYMDISASYTFLEKVEHLNEIAETNRATAVLSVGLAPGLTNLLASWVKKQLDDVQEIDIYLMLGLGDEHGKAAIEWTLLHARTNFLRSSNGWSASSRKKL
jgi:saccharopine dehydrogenase (NAD+, L-lysine-forming)